MTETMRRCACPCGCRCSTPTSAMSTTQGICWLCRKLSHRPGR